MTEKKHRAPVWFTQAVSRRLRTVSLAKVKGGWSWKFDPRIFEERDPGQPADDFARLACRVAAIYGERSAFRMDRDAVLPDRFMECLLSLQHMRWAHEPMAVRRRRESADKSDALQTLRAVRRRPAVAKRLECVRLQRRFSRSWDPMAGQVHGEESSVSRPAPWHRPRFSPRKTSWPQGSTERQ